MKQVNTVPLAFPASADLHPSTECKIKKVEHEAHRYNLYKECWTRDIHPLPTSRKPGTFFFLKQIEVYDGSDGGTGSSAEVSQDTQHKASGPADIVEILYNRTATWQVTRVCLSDERPEIWEVDSHRSRC